MMAFNESGFGAESDFEAKGEAWDDLVATLRERTTNNPGDAEAIIGAAEQIRIEDEPAATKYLKDALNKIDGE